SIPAAQANVVNMVVISGSLSIPALTVTNCQGAGASPQVDREGFPVRVAQKSARGGTQPDDLALAIKLEGRPVSDRVKHLFCVASHCVPNHRSSYVTISIAVYRI
ncbi:MAG: hypothetical protein KDB71_17565, partial [Mycobacterium sp.]|nr:hypothetical protein [Mycobacterium sp.]